ncbi:MAG: T9SS type A sorting domain-containing protein [Bacteroidetes bacterium]|nr:T9SS type A sorting domain-containing protein [Bacteroidota bacterium]
MKRTLLSLFAVLAFSSAIFAQTGWTSVNSNLATGTGVGQVSIGMNNHDALWAFGIDATGAIVDVFTKSTDAGLTWTAGTFNAGTGLSQIFAIDENTCWALFNTGATQGIYKTTDGGTTWTKKGTAYSGGSFADAMHFFNNNDGFAIGDPLGGYYEIYTTTDGGETWTRVPQGNIPAPTTGEYGITGDYSASGNDVWFGTNQGRIFHSANKGLNWTCALTAFGNAEVVAPEFADPLHGIAYRSYLNMGVEPTINITTDGGATWVTHDVGGTWYARYVEYVPGTVETYVGSSSEAGSNGASYSYDGGYNWSLITANFDFQATAWLDVATGWAGSIAAAKKSTAGMYIYAGDSLLPLTANFVADYTSIGYGQSVTFTNLSSGFPVSWNWVFQGGAPAAYSGKTPPPIVYVLPGSYTVTLKASNLYTTDTLIKTNYIYVGGVGVNEHSKSSITVFPDPVQDVLNIQASTNVQEVQVINMIGQVVLNQTFDNKNITMNTSNLKAGIYNLKVKLEDGYINKKIVVN